MRVVNKSEKSTILPSVTCKLFTSKGDYSVAYGSITIADCFVVNIQLVDGKKGLFISFPHYKDNNGDFKDNAFPITSEFRKEIENVIFTEAKRMGLIEDDN